ncbi:MAG TPA: glycosyltransferase family 4 protein [Longimicrobiaceae bacterium]|nr:glycosyltransferase family 4 protein [Longimicrobiaceae bacterium]
MKVGLVVPGGVDRTGTERVIPILLALVQRVARAHELHVFALRQEPRPARWPLLGAQVHNAGTRFPSARALADVAREHRRAPFDVLHGVWSTQGLVAGAAGRLCGRPVLLHLVGADLGAAPEIGWGALLTRRGRARVRAAAALAQHVTVNSSFMVERAARLGIRPERLPYGVSVQDWPPLPPRRRDPAAPARLLFVASLNPVKDPWTLLRGAAALRRRGVPFHLDLIGFDTLDGEVHRLAAELELGEVVRFHGFMDQERLRPWMERADLLLVTSRHECGPIVALEAALVGVPTVGTPVGHLAHWAPHALAPVPVGDPEALADAVAALLGDEERRLALAAAAQRIALAEDADAAAARVLELYEGLARERRP